MKDIDKIIADLQAWVEEDSENRAIALVAVQKLEDKEKSYRSQQHTATYGMKGYLIDAFQNVMNGKATEDCLRDVLEQAMRHEAMMGLIKIADNFDKNDENNA